MQNPHSDDILSAYIDGELTPEEQARVERLLESSTAAKQEVEDLRSISELVQGLPRQSLGPDFAAEVLQAAERRMLLPDPPQNGAASAGATADGIVADGRRSADVAGVIAPAILAAPAAVATEMATPVTQPQDTKRRVFRWLAVGAPVAAAVALLVSAQFIDWRGSELPVASRGLETQGAPATVAETESSGAADREAHSDGDDALEVAAQSQPMLADNEQPGARRNRGLEGPEGFAAQSNRPQEAAPTPEARMKRSEGGRGAAALGLTEESPEVAALGRPSPPADSESRDGNAGPQAARIRKGAGGKLEQAPRVAAAPLSAAPLNRAELEAGEQVVDELLQNQQAARITIVKVYVQDTDASLQNLQALLARHAVAPDTAESKVARRDNAAPPSAPLAARTGEKSQAAAAANALLVEANATQLTAALAELQSDSSVVDLKVDGTVEIAALDPAARDVFRQFTAQSAEAIGAATDEAGREASDKTRLQMKKADAVVAAPAPPLSAAPMADAPVAKAAKPGTAAKKAEAEAADSDRTNPSSRSKPAGQPLETGKSKAAPAESKPANGIAASDPARKAGTAGTGFAAQGGRAENDAAEQKPREAMAAVDRRGETGSVVSRQRALNLSLDRLAERQRASSDNAAKSAEQGAGGGSKIKDEKMSRAAPGASAADLADKPQRELQRKQTDFKLRERQQVAGPIDGEIAVQVIFVFEQAEPAKE